MRWTGILVAALLATPRSVGAFELPFEATLSIQFGTIAPLATQTVTRNANVSLDANGRIASLQLETIDIATTGVQVFPVPTQYAPIGGLQGTFGAWPTAGQQTFVRQTNDRLGGVVRMLGVVRICLFAPTGCPGSADVFLPLAHSPGSFAPYTAAIGWGGTWSFLASPFFSFTVRGAPWTTGTVNPGGGMTGMGFAHGPASQPGMTALFGGEMNLVTPLFISSTLNGNPNPDFPGVATLAIRFTPLVAIRWLSRPGMDIDPLRRIRFPPPTAIGCGHGRFAACPAPSWR
jgi:hypothetical protein